MMQSSHANTEQPSLFTWTASEVRARLPLVPFMHRGRIWYAKVTGRANDHASVHLYECPETGECTPLAACRAYAWTTLAHILNTDSRPQWQD